MKYYYRKIKYFQNLKYWSHNILNEGYMKNIVKMLIVIILFLLSCVSSNNNQQDIVNRTRIELFPDDYNMGTSKNSRNYSIN